MNDGIEKLQEYAFGMSQRRCDDILLLADQIKREHVSELQALEAEMDKRLMPPGMEWPKDRNENPFDPRKLYDSGCGAVDFVRIGFVNGEQWASVVSHDGNDLLPEELGDCEPEVLGADGLPIKVGETVWYVGEPLVRGTVEAVGEGEVMLAGDGVYAPLDLTHTQPDTQERIDDDATMYPHEYCKKHGIQAGTPDNELFVLSDFVEPMALDLLRRQRELDARTMGGE